MRRILLTPTCRRVREAEIHIIEGALGAFGQIHDVASGSVGRSVGGFEIEDATDIAIGVERQALDPILRVVGKEVASLVAARKLGTVIDKTAGNRCIASVVRIRVNGIGVGGIAVRPFDVGPAIVGAPQAEFNSSMAVEAIVATDIADQQPTRRRVVIGAIGIAQPQRPYGVVIGSAPS